MSVDHYAVFGHPISHSKSPRIHALFAESTGQAIDYRAQDVAPAEFRSAVRAFFAGGGKGLNCTVPLKELAYQLTSCRSERAERAKAVNTLIVDGEGRLLADNTDGVGLLRDLTRNLQLELTGRRVLLLGAGGASRGVLQPLLAENPERLVIANRTPERAEILAAEFADLGKVEACGFERLKGRHFELIINATAASLSHGLPPLPDDALAENGCCYDLAYGVEPTVFVRWGQERGARISVDGIGMLVEQAAEAFFLWRGVMPATGEVIARLNQERQDHRVIGQR